MTRSSPKATSTKNGRRVTAALIIATALILTGAVLGTVLSRGTDAGTSRASTIPAIAPADADTLVVAPYAPSWWEKISAMAPSETRLTGLEPGGSGIELTHVGYSRSPDTVERDVPMTGPYRLFYAEAANEEDAERFAGWLREAEGFGGRQIHLSGSIVIVAQSWVGTFQVPAQAMSSNAAYKATGAGDASMWRSPDQEVLSLAGTSDSVNGKALTAVMRSGFGFTQGTTWQGSSTDGVAWAGDFGTGGVDPARIDFRETQKVLDESSHVIGEITDGNVKYQALSGGLANILSAATFRSEEKGSIGPGRPAAPFTAVRDEAVSVVADVTGWNAAATGIYSSPENITTQALSANKHEMVISYGYGVR